VEVSLKRDNAALQSIANRVRRHIVTMLAEAGSGHPGGSLGAADIGVCLYFGVMRHDPANPNWPDRDRFILSKGHCCPLLYALLAESGYFPVDELMTLRKLGSRLQGHPSMKDTPGVEMSSGSLGQGLSFGNGAALAARLDGRPTRVYVLIGDGESQEGQVWEAAMASAHYKLDNVCAIIDWNGLQIDGPITDVMSPLPLADKWRAFRWNVIEVDGHDCEQVLSALHAAANHKGRPTAIIAKTIKGKGVSFMEDQVGWHGKAPSAEERDRALADLEG